MLKMIAQIQLKSNRVQLQARQSSDFRTIRTFQVFDCLLFIVCFVECIITLNEKCVPSKNSNESKETVTNVLTVHFFTFEEEEV
jgi:hypothetical protein